MTSQGINTDWLIIPRPRPMARMRLFCFPYAGGGATAYWEWPERILKEVEVVLVELPGRGRKIRENLYTAMPPLIQQLVGQITPFLDKPFTFFGHSMGALLAFELSHSLREREGKEPRKLYLSGREAPHIPDPREKFHLLTDKELLQKLEELNGTPKEVLQSKELMELMLPIIRADFAMCETYQYAPREPLSCPITVFGGAADKNVPVSGLQEWKTHTRSQFRLHVLPGDHFFIYQEKEKFFYLLNEDLTALLMQEGVQVVQG